MGRRPMRKGGWRGRCLLVVGVKMKNWKKGKVSKGKKQGRARGAGAFQGVKGFERFRP